MISKGFYTALICENDMFEKLEDILRKSKNKIGSGLVIVSLVTLVSCTSAEAIGLVTDMAVKGAYGAVVSFGQHAGKRVSEALLGAEQIRIVGADGKESVKTISPKGYNPVNDPEIKDIKLSTDRTQAVFAIDFGEQYELFRVNVDGSNLERLTFTPNENEILPTISLDEKSIAFIKYNPTSLSDAGVDMYILDLDNRKEKKYQSCSSGHKYLYRYKSPIFHTKTYRNEFWCSYLPEYLKYFKIEWEESKIDCIGGVPKLYFNYHKSYGWEEVYKPVKR